VSATPFTIFPTFFNNRSRSCSKRECQRRHWNAVTLMHRFSLCKAPISRQPGYSFAVIPGDATWCGAVPLRIYMLQWIKITGIPSA
jgi:hypothetical protein